MKKNKSSITTRPLYCDNNAFARMSEEENYNMIVERLSQSHSPKVHELIRAITMKKLIKHPSAILELFWLPQKAIHQRLEAILPTLQSNIKRTLDPFLINLKNSSEKLNELMNGFDKIYCLIFEEFKSYLTHTESELTFSNILSRALDRKKDLSKPSRLFLTMYNHIKLHLTKNFVEEIIMEIALEAIARFGKKLLSDIYKKDKVLVQNWTAFIASVYTGFWDRGYNFSAFRITAEKLYNLNQKK